MPDRPNFNAENPPKPTPITPPPTGVFHVPAAVVQPMIDPVTGVLVVPTPPKS